MRAPRKNARQDVQLPRALAMNLLHQRDCFTYLGRSQFKVLERCTADTAIRGVRFELIFAVRAPRKNASRDVRLPRALAMKSLHQLDCFTYLGRFQFKVLEGCTAETATGGS